MDESGSSLRELFSSAKGKQEELDSSTATYQETLQSAISAYEQCRQHISRLAIFSPNEEVEDISTQDLQYNSTILVLTNTAADYFTDTLPSTTCWQSF